MSKIRVVKFVRDTSLDNGLYRIHWGSGGISLALIHRDAAGNVLFQCANWINRSSVRLADHEPDIEFIELIESSNA